MIVRGSSLFWIASACLLAVVSCGKFPEFLPVQYSKSEANREDVVTAKTYGVSVPLSKTWYASWPTTTQMTLTGGSIIKEFVFKCRTKQLEGKDQLTNIKYCFGDKCETLVVKTDKTIKVGNIPDVRITFEQSHGGEVTFSNVEKEQKLNFKFSCSVSNRMGTIQSNTLSIRDFRYRVSQSTVKNVNVKNLIKGDPKTFPCFLKAIANPGDPPLNVRWSYCFRQGNIDAGRCAFENIKLRLNDWPVYVKDNGDLYVPYFSEKAVDALQNRILSCHLDGQIATYYEDSVITFSNAEATNPVTQLKMIRPKKNEKITIYDSKATDVTFLCNFEIGKGKYTIKWTHESKDGKRTILTGTRSDAGAMLEGSNGVRFKGPFNDKTPGKYICEVSWTPELKSITSNRQKDIGTYDLEVLFFPTVSPKMVPMIYVVDGENGTVQCLFEDKFPSAPQGFKVTPSLAINGKKLDISSARTVNDGVKSVNNDYKSVMAALTVFVSPTAPKPNQVVTYTAEKMSYKSTLTNLPSSHLVQCTGTNEIGSVRTTTQLKVVPKPIIQLANSPGSFNCTTECSAAEEHTVRCVVSNKEAINQSGVVFGQYWQLGIHRVDNMMISEDAPARKYLIVSPDATTLTIKKIDDTDFRDTVNELKKIECVLTLGYPDDAKLPVGVMEDGLNKRLFFISSNSDMRSQLTTPIKLSHLAPPLIKTGSMAWVIALVLALLIILIIIAILYAYCRKRKSGEEYNVDAKEKQQGHDPEVEVAEKEAFPVFERPEDGPIRGSRASLDDSIHVGSDDEDEVLAEYDVDIGKFDEEGSFIGQYAVNDAGAGNRRLPEVGNNTEV